MSNKKINIRDLSIDDIDNIIISLEEKAFRSKQIIDWIWNKGIDSFDKMKNIPAKILNNLKENYCINQIKIIQHQKSTDGTEKFLFESVDNFFFEGVLIKSKNRITACISTQIGCALACKFCESGKNGFERNLSIGEIFDQILLMNKQCVENNTKISNIVIMGMGEPLLNYDNVINFINHITSKYSYGFSPARITLSTVGIVPQIKKIADNNLKINMAISLHTVNNNKRNLIMPINKKYNLEQLKEAIKYYYKKTGNRITYEYLMLKNINDSLSDAIALAEFTKISPCKINIIEYNEVSDCLYKQAEKEKLNIFYEYLFSKNLIVNIRKSKGTDINAACGQLAKKNK